MSSVGVLETIVKDSVLRYSVTSLRFYYRPQIYIPDEHLFMMMYDQTLTTDAKVPSDAYRRHCRNYSGFQNSIWYAEVIERIQRAIRGLPEVKDVKLGTNVSSLSLQGKRVAYLEKWFCDMQIMDTINRHATMFLSFISTCFQSLTIQLYTIASRFRSDRLSIASLSVL